MLRCVVFLLACVFIRVLCVSACVCMCVTEFACVLMNIFFAVHMYASTRTHACVPVNCVCASFPVGIQALPSV